MIPALRDATAQHELIAALVPRWRMLATCAALGLAIGGAYAVVAPEWYQARIAVLPSQDGESGKLAKMAALGAAAGLSPTVSIDVQRIHAVLSSVSVADKVIARFELQERYGASSIEQARKRLWEHCGTSIELKAGIVALTCEDRDPQLARDLAAYFGEAGNAVFERITVSVAREERRFLDQMVVKARDDVDRASRALRDFQQRHRVVDLPAQSTATISAMATLEGELISRRIQLSYLRGFASSDEPKVRQLTDQVAIVERELRELEAAAPAADARAGFFPGAARVPELRFELEQLLRAQKIHETVFLMLTQRLAMARVDEARDTSTFQILDAPTLPMSPSRPRRARIVGLGAAGGLALGVLWIVGPIWWRRRVRVVIKQDDKFPKEIGP